MRCHYINDKKAGKVLIPGCMEVALFRDIDRCTCYLDKHKSTEERLLKLESEVAKLKSIIKKLE